MGIRGPGKGAALGAEGPSLTNLSLTSSEVSNPQAAASRLLSAGLQAVPPTGYTGSQERKTNQGRNNGLFGCYII